MCPVYGLAEASVALTIPALGHQASDRHRPARAVPAGRPGAAGRGGRSLSAPPRGLWPTIAGTRGAYRGQDRATSRRARGGAHRVPRTISHLRIFPEPEGHPRCAPRVAGWIRATSATGPSGDLFVTGRQKDLIIKAGRNLYPQEVEEIVGAVTGIRKGCVAAFGVHDAAIGTERLVVIAESRETRPGTAIRASGRCDGCRGHGAGPARGHRRDRGARRRAQDLERQDQARAPRRMPTLAGTMARPRSSARIQWVRLLASALRARL